MSSKFEVSSSVVRLGTNGGLAKSTNTEGAPAKPTLNNALERPLVVFEERMRADFLTPVPAQSDVGGGQKPLDDVLGVVAYGHVGRELQLGGKVLNPVVGLHKCVRVEGRLAGIASRTDHADGPVVDFDTVNRLGTLETTQDFRAKEVRL